MSDHVAIVRKTLRWGRLRVYSADFERETKWYDDALAALDALVVERDEARGFCLAADQDAKAAESELTAWKVRAREWEKRARAAEAEVARLREALRSVENCGDLAAVRIARDALAAEETT